jgi:hypothetical protein
MAGIIGLFLSSLCVIKVVRESYHFHFCVPTVTAATRVRAFQEDRRQAWGKGICVGLKIPSRCLVHSQRWTIFCLHTPRLKLGKFGKIVLTIPFFYRGFFFTFSNLCHLWSQFQGQLRVVGTVESWCIDIVCIYLTGSQPID